MKSGAPFKVASYRIEPSLLRVQAGERETRLEAKAMAVLVYLAQHAGRVVSRSELEEKLWPGLVVTEDAVTNAIVKLRRVLGDSARQPRVIETIPKTGYRLIAPVVWLEPADLAEFATGQPPVRRSRGRIAAWLAGISIIALALLASPSLFDNVRSPVSDGGPSASRPALAVLAFENLGPSPKQDYFANGVTADLITDLSKVSGLLVIAPGALSADRDAAARAQISMRPDVDYVLAGTVQRQEQRLRVNVQLIDVRNEQALWAERFEGGRSEIFAIQDRLTSDVIAALKVTLAPTERDFLARRPTISVAAYDAYLQGIESHGHRSREQNLVAREYFRRAIDLDSGFARAYTGLALTHSRDAIDGWVTTPLPSLERAAELAAIAKAIDPSLPQVHFVSAQVDLFARRHEQAIAAAQRAIEIAPNYADAHALIAWILNYAGRTDEAEASMTTAFGLNSHSTASYLEVLGEIRFVQRRYTESAAVFEQVLDINPNYMRARMWLAAALAENGARGRAEWEAIELMVLSPDFALERLEFAFPFKDPRQLDNLMDGLRKAGLPD